MSILDERLKKNSPELHRLNLDLPKQMNSDLKAYAKARGVTVAKLLRTMIELNIYPETKSDQQ
ncbi:hypothetical protein SIO92_000125 [Burkholderia cenocepacia]|nr:hypothetical protein [Burkholderia cenocepacia]